MNISVGVIVAIANLVLGIIILSLLMVSLLKLRDSKNIFGVAFSFAIVAVIFVIHAAVEVFGYGEFNYAVTALAATLLLGYAIFLLRKESMHLSRRGKK